MVHVPEADLPDDDDKPPLPWSLVYRLRLLNDDEDDELPMVHSHPKPPGQQIPSRRHDCNPDGDVINDESALAGTWTADPTGIRPKEAAAEVYIRAGFIYLLFNFFFFLHGRERAATMYGSAVEALRRRR